MFDNVWSARFPCVNSNGKFSITQIENLITELIFIPLFVRVFCKMYNTQPYFCYSFSIVANVKQFDILINRLKFQSLLIHSFETYINYSQWDYNSLAKQWKTHSTIKCDRTERNICGIYIMGCYRFRLISFIISCTFAEAELFNVAEWLVVWNIKLQDKRFSIHGLRETSVGWINLELLLTS